MTTSESRAQPASRRVKRRVLFAIAVLVVGALVLGLAFWTRDASSSTPSPLGPSNGGGPDINSPLFYRSVRAPFGDAKTNLVLGFKPHSEFRFGFNIWNRGDSPVRIEGVVPPEEGWLGMAPIRRLLFQPKPQNYTLDGATEAPLTIEPGKDAFLIPVIETGDPCRRHYSKGGSQSFDSIHLRYRYRGRERTEWYSMPFVVGIVCGNPKFVIDRVVSP